MHYSRVPSAKVLRSTFNLFPDEASAIRAVLRGELDPADASAACARWVRDCYHVPPWRERAAYAVNALLGGHGVEGITDASGRVVATYVNMGDTYAATLLFNHATGTVYVTTVGDFVERWERRHAALP